MPLLTDPKRIAELRKQFPILTHTSWKELSEIEPRPNVDKHHQYMGDIVCATSSDADFYALRCNERPGMINWSYAYRDSKGIPHKIFIFEKMKDTYYEHHVSSKDFIPVVSKEGVFSGEWISRDLIKPVSVKKGSKEDILNQTTAQVLTITSMDEFKNKMASIKGEINSETALKTVNALISEGILKKENDPEDQTTLIDTLENGTKNGKRRSLNLMCENNMKPKLPDITPEM